MIYMKILTANQTRRAEQNTFNIGISGERLMENAGSAAARIISRNFHLQNIRAVVVVGQGNNGGDGYVVARKLKEYGAKVSVIMAMGFAMTRDSALMQKRAEQSQVPTLNYYDNKDLAENLIDTADIIVDAIFGIGFHGAADREISVIIERINRSSAKKIALDIPSGVIADSGEVIGSAIKANLTVSFIGYKPCHFEYPSNEYCGKTVAVSIGIEDKYIDEFSAEVIEPENALKMLKVIPRNAHKGTKGTALIIGGCYGMVGAPMISAKAAMRSGVGIVKVCLPRTAYSAAAPMLPEAVFVPTKDDLDYLSADCISKDLFKNINSLLIGPGMSLNDLTVGAVIKAIAFSKVPTVIDADGLNALSSNLEVLKEISVPLIVTPHPGEMSRLIGKSVDEIQKNRMSVALEFAREYGVITVLKGAYTVIALPDGKVYINTTGNEGMATAGSGDMLAGMIAAFLANGMDPAKAVVSAVSLHGAAGDKAAEKFGIRGLMVSDIIEQLHSLLNNALGDR